MIEKQMYEWSFELTKYIISETLNYDINEIDDFIYSDIASICKEILEKIIKKTNGTAIENEIYEWAIKNISGSTYDELYKSLLKENFGDGVYLRRKLQFIENKISSIKAVESEYPPAEEYEIVPLMVYKLNLMKKLGYDDTETQKIKSEYISYPEIRKIIINEFIDNSEYEKAIDLLIESRKKDANSKWNIYDYTVRLKNLYKITGNIDGL